MPIVKVKIPEGKFCREKNIRCMFNTADTPWCELFYKYLETTNTGWPILAIRCEQCLALKESDNNVY